MSLAADSLLATTGVFPDTVSPRDLERAQEVPAKFERRLRAWVRSTEQAPFEYVAPKQDMERLFSRLAEDPTEPLVEQWIEGLGVERAELAGEFYGAIMRARAHLVGVWPKFVIEGPVAPQILPLSIDDTAEVWSLFQVVEDPTRVLDELDAFTLTASQAEAFRLVYPDLFALANDAIKDEMTERLARNPAFELGWQREGVLNTLRGLPPEKPPALPPPPVQPTAKLEIDADRDKTQAEVSAAPKGSKR